MNSPTLPADLWRGISREWLWVYRRAVPSVSHVWSGTLSVPDGCFIVERGEARIRASDKEIQVPKGHAFVTGPGTRQQWFAPGTRLLSVGFRGELAG